MKNKIKKIIPYKIFDLYYYSSAILSALVYSFPSKKMIVVGVTGTKGKTSTINFIWSCLTAGGYKTGIISTANIRIGETESMNKYHMTMPGRFVIQSLMSDMARQGCRFCIIETTSEGIKQHRNVGISYDILVFTNLFPEHLPSHDNSFEKYKETKGVIFKDLNSSYRKIVAGDEIKKTIIVNNDSDHAGYYSSFQSDEKFTFSINKNSDYKADNISNTKSGVKFDVNGEEYETKILGKFNIYNALPAIIISKLFKIEATDIRKGLKHLELIPGRMEIIDEGQDFTVVVDYAHEKESMTNLLQTAVSIRKPDSKIIVLLGAEGGGRDKAKRPLMGEISAKMADYVIVANVDPYEDDPKEIIEDIARSSEKFGKIRNRNLFTIEDRKTAIEKAFDLAKTNDIVLITGKGAEQSMIIDGKSIPWDDRKVVRSILLQMKNK